MEEFRKDWVMGLKLEDCRGIATLFSLTTSCCIQSCLVRITVALPASEMICSLAF